MSGSLLPGDHRVSLAHGGLDRAYLLHLPPHAGPLPLVMMLHGAGGSAELAADETGWSALADREGFAVVYPEGVPARPGKAPKFLTNPQEWTDGSGRGGRDDVGFLTAVLDDVGRHAEIDPRRVYVTGFSNGAGMAFRLAAERADRIAAVGPLAGHCWVHGPRPVRPVPTIYMAGDADPVVPLYGGTARTPWGLVRDRPAVKDTLVRWGKAIDQPFGSDRFPVWVIRGHGHHWPGGKALLGEQLGGPASDTVDATAELWRFFREHHL